MTKKTKKNRKYIKHIKQRKQKKHKKTKGGRKQDAKVTEEEMNKCNNMCSTTYMTNLKSQTVDDFNKNPFLKGLNKSNVEIEANIENDRAQHLSDCKSIFCNPKCGRNERIRYMCPLCEKSENRVKQLGAITFCQHTAVI
jgi:hypothetical protein